MSSDALTQLRDGFRGLAQLGSSFEECLVAVLPALNRIVPDAENWQLVFDLLHWDWEGLGRAPVPIDLQDQLSLALSPWRSETAAILRRQDASAQEWADALNAAGLSPSEALGLAKADIEMTVEKESALTAVATHKSAIAAPLEIVRQYRQFYRASKMYSPERTNALKPLLLAKEVIQRSSSTGEDLAVEVAGRIAAHLAQVRRGTAKGRWVISSQDAERQAISEFARFLVHHLLGERFRGDKSQFSSKTGIGLIEDACFFLYLLEQEKENDSKEDSRG